MYTHPDSQLCFQDSVHKDWIIEVIDNGTTIETITNERIYKDEINITDSLCSNEDITLGACESVELELKLSNNGNKYEGKKFKVSLVLNNHTSTPIPIGEFKVAEDELEDDQRVRNIKAYDALYELNTKDFAPWFNNLSFPMTLKEFRDSFFQYAGIEQETVTLVNDWVPFNFVVTNSSATKRMLEEEQEKRNQLVDAAEKGLSTTKYTLIDPQTYDSYGVEVDTYNADANEGFVASFTEVMIEVGVEYNPKELGWFELNTDGVYFLSQDTEVIYNRKYYEQDTPSASINPKTNGWYEYGKTENAVGYFTTSDKKVKKDSKSKIYKTYYVKHTSTVVCPKDLVWYVINGVGEDAKYVQTIDETPVSGRNYYLSETIDPPVPHYEEYIFDPNELEPNPKEKNLFEYDYVEQKHIKTTDTVRDENKTYYQLVSVENNNTAFLKLNLDAHRVDNPKEEGWYELITQGDGKDYVKTEDTTIDRTKDYYFNIYEELLKVDKDIVEDQILGSEIVQAICEINGCFGHIGRDGKFKYIYLKPIDYEDLGLYPASDLYPDPELYPAGAPYDQEINRGYYEDITRSDYLVKKIDRLVICKEDGDAGYIYPEDSLPDNHNTYKITGNFIWYSFTGDKATLDLAGGNILIYGVAQISEYTPCTIDMMGNPCVEVGDTIKIHTRTGDIYTYVMSRTLSGSQRLKDSIEAKGNKERSSENSLYDAVIELKGKSNILTRTVDETRSEIIDASEGLSSLISQMADSITLSVSRDLKRVEDGSRTLFEATTEYTDYKIKDTVSRKEYDENNVLVSQSFSEFERTADYIQARVERSLEKTGTGEGFEWELLSSGMIWRSMGGFVDVTNQLPNDFSHVQFDIYEIDAQTQSMVLTPDTTKAQYKSYYKAANESSSYEDVMRITNTGLWVRGAITTEMLDVRSVATIDTLNTRMLDVTGTLTALSGRITTLEGDYARIHQIVAEEISTATIKANQIVGGTVKASQIDTNTLEANVITALSAHSYNEGTIQIGKMKPGRLYFNNNDAMIPDGAYAHAFLQVVPRKVKGASGSSDYWALVVSTAQ